MSPSPPPPPTPEEVASLLQRIGNTIDVPEIHHGDLISSILHAVAGAIYGDCVPELCVLTSTWSRDQLDKIRQEIRDDDNRN